MGNKNHNIHQPSFSIETPDMVSGFFVSPNKKFVLIGYGSENIRIYDLDTQTMIMDFEGCCFSKITNSVVNISFSPDNTLVAYRW